VPKGYYDQSQRDKAIITRLVNVEFTKNMGMVGGGVKMALLSNSKGYSFIYKVEYILRLTL